MSSQALGSFSRRLQGEVEAAAERLSREAAAQLAADPLVERPLVSVVIPCRNVAGVVLPVFEALEAQSYQDFEVILNLDERSTDGSQALLEGWVKEHPRYRLVLENRGASQARNQGFTHAQGRYVLYLDADLAPTRTVIEEAVWQSERNALDAVVCPELSVTYNVWGEARSLEKLAYLGDSLQESSARFMRSSAAKALGGYDESLWAGEDYDYFQRAKAAGYKGGRINSISWHQENWTLLGKASKLFKYARSFSPYLKRYPKLGAQQFFIVRQAYLVQARLYFRHWPHTLVLIFSNTLFYGWASVGLVLGLWDVYVLKRRPF